MKIHQLPMGARFEYEGEEYVKTAPLFATGRHGQKLIPRYAVLKPLGDVEVPPKKVAKDIAGEEVLAAFEAFYGECRALVPVAGQAALASARDRFLGALDLVGEDSDGACGKS